jgi:leader peptidase (prepilin peptidase) / N-methyltransferase
MTHTHHLIVEGVLLAIGAALGSFLNVCIYRIPARQSLLHPPSRCPGCSRAIAWRDNIPVLAWIILGGHCRSCRRPISIRYPAVELCTGLLFVAVYWVVIVQGSIDLTEANGLSHIGRVIAIQLVGSCLLTAGLIVIDTRLVPGRVVTNVIGDRGPRSVEAKCLGDSSREVLDPIVDPKA